MRSQRIAICTVLVVLVVTVDIEDEPYVKVNYTITDRTTDKKTDYDYKINLQLYQPPVSSPQINPSHP